MSPCAEGSRWSPPCMQIPAPLTKRRLIDQLSNTYASLYSNRRHEPMSIIKNGDRRALPLIHAGPLSHFPSTLDFRWWGAQGAGLPRWDDIIGSQPNVNHSLQLLWAVLYFGLTCMKLRIAFSAVLLSSYGCNSTNS